MRPSPLLRLAVQSLDISLELFAIDPPDTSTTDLDRRQHARSDEGVHLRNADVEIDRYVLIVLMTSGLVVAIWAVARDRLIDIVSAALSTVCGPIGC